MPFGIKYTKQPIQTIGFAIVPNIIDKITIPNFLQKFSGYRQFQNKLPMRTGPQAIIATGKRTGIPIINKNRRPILSRRILHLPQSSLGLSCNPGQPKGFNALK